MSAISLKHLRLLGPEEDAGGGGNGPAGNEQGGVDTQLEQGSDSNADGEGGEYGGDEGDAGQGTTKPVVKKTTTAPVAKPAELTDERIAEITARVLGKAQGAQQQRQQPEMTQEQLDKLLNPVRITRESMAELLGIEDPATITDKRLQAMQNVLNATVKNSTSVSHLMLEQRMRAVMQGAAPMQQYIAEQQAAQQKQAFFTRHPKLEKFGKFVQFAAAQVKPTKADGSEKTIPEAMDEIAGIVKSTLKEAGVDIDAPELDANGNEISSSTNTNHSAGSGGVPKMASLQSPGRGSGTSGKGGKSSNPDADIYT